MNRSAKPISREPEPYLGNFPLNVGTGGGRAAWLERCRASPLRVPSRLPPQKSNAHRAKKSIPNDSYRCYTAYNCYMRFHRNVLFIWERKYIHGTDKRYIKPNRPAKPFNITDFGCQQAKCCKALAGASRHVQLALVCAGRCGSPRF